MPSGVFSTACDIDVTYYPFDSQTCLVIFSTLMSSDKETDLAADALYGVSLSLYSETGTWDLVKAYTTTLFDSR